MEIKKLTFVLMMLAAQTACQSSLIEDRQTYGSLSLQLDNSSAVQVTTRADDGDAVSVDDFNVYVSSDDATFSYVYKDMPSVVTLPVGLYVVSADNITEAQALSLPDEWGQVRYAGTSEQVNVVAGLNPVYVSLTCKMVNTAVSVVFGENIDKHFSGYSITAYTDESRKLVFTPENTVGENPATAYYSPEKKLNYVFAGTYLDDSEPMVITGSKLLQPATHLHLTFRMSEQNGSVGRPVIEVDTTCEDLYETITVDPTEDGSFITE